MVPPALCPLSRSRGQADNKRAVFADVSICIFEDIFNPYEYWERSACARVTTTGDHLTSTLHPSPPRKHLPLIDTVISNTVAFASQPSVFPVREERNEIVSFLSEHDYLYDIIAGFVPGHRIMIVWQTYILERQYH